MSEYRTKEEEIKARMVRTASRLWGQPNSSAESFDPLVGMLLGACSVEMGRVYNELESSQARILERLAGLLTPEVQRGPKAAHAILQARANEPVGDLSKEFHFYYQKKLPQRENSLKEEYTSVYFTPVANTRVFDARVAALASGNSIWSIDGSNEKSLIAQSRETRLGNGQAHSLATSIYIGIDISRRVKSLNGMSFYFDWPFSSDKTSLYQSLENSKLFLGTKELKLSRGFQTAESFDSLTSLKSLLENDLCRIEEREIAMLYHPRFLTINDESEISLDHDLKNHPQEFSDVFDASALKQFNQPLLWLRLDVFSPRADISKDIQCLLNCFPIMSRHLNEFSYRLQSNTNIIPLKVDGEVFYSMCSLRGSDNKPFVRNTTKDFTKSKSGTFLLRQGGIERFDKRDASELLNYLIDLLRDESAAFAVYGNDLISSNLRELNQMLNSLIQRVEHTEVNDEQLTYLVIKPIEEGDNVFVEFWSTSGAFANQIRSGVRFVANSGYDVNPESITLISTTSGGRDTPDKNELIALYRRALMTRGRVVTAGDIELFIRSLDTQALIGKIQIERGVENNSSSKIGLTRNVVVRLNALDPHKQMDWDNFCFEIETRLKNESNSFFPIRVAMAITDANLTEVS